MFSLDRSSVKYLNASTEVFCKDKVITNVGSFALEKLIPISVQYLSRYNHRQEEKRFHKKVTNDEFLFLNLAA